MKQTIIVDREDIQKVQQEEQFNFIMAVLIDMGLPIEEHIPENGLEGFTVDHKIKFRHFCNLLGVTVLDDLDGGVKIYVNQEKAPPIMVAEWKKPWVTLKMDPYVLDKSKRLYAEISIEAWTVFEEADDGTGREKGIGS